MTKRALAAALFVALAAITALLWWRDGSGATGPHPAPPGRTDATAAPPGGPVAPMADTQRERAGEDPATAADAAAGAARPVTAGAGELVVAVTYARDDTPARGIGVRVRRAPVGAPVLTADEGTTDDAGTARFADLPPGRVAIELDRGASADAVIRVGTTTDVAFVIARALDVDGIVVDRDGGAVAGAEVWLGAFDASLPPLLAAHSAADGTFVLRDVPAQRFVSARCSGYAPSIQYEVYGADGKSSLRVVLPAAGGTLRGRVTDAARRAVAGADVQLGELLANTLLVEAGHYALPTFPRRVRSDADGRFACDDLPAGAVAVAVRAAGFAPWHGTADVPLGGSNELAVALDAGVSLAGCVRDADGRAVAGATIEVHPDQHWRDDALTVQTDDDGNYAARSLAAGELTITVDAPGHGGALAKVQGTAGAALRQDFALAAVAELTLTGTIVDEAGNGVAAQLEVAAVSGDWSTEGESAADGTFAVEHCPNARLNVHVAAGLLPMTEVREVDPTRGALRIVVRRDQLPSARIRGRVLRSDGQPAVQAAVVLRHRDASGESLFTVDATAATFELGPVPPGPYTIRVLLDDHARWSSETRTLAPLEVWDLGDVRPAPR